MILRPSGSEKLAKKVQNDQHGHVIASTTGQRIQEEITGEKLESRYDNGHHG